MDVNTSAAFADNPIIYFLVTDRFYRCRPGRPAPYGRLGDQGEIGAFHGGDFAGVTRQIDAGWFTSLGVNAIWISAPYEQIRGWVPGAGHQFRHEAYHGYWALDYTVPDQNFGDGNDFAALVSAAHGRDIKIIIDVVLSHAGYPDLRTLHEFVPGAVRPGWQSASPLQHDQFITGDADTWAQWWGHDWVRATLPGYLGGGDDELTALSFNLPKFRTEDDTPVGLPPFLRNKRDSAAIELGDMPVRGYLIAWLTEWVRSYGIDGFRCDSAKHVDLRCWSQLKHAATEALAQWKAENPQQARDAAPFWMTGEVFGQGIERNAYFDEGFDNLINFDFQLAVKAIFQHVDMEHAYARSLAMFRLDKLYTRYAACMVGASRHRFLSYLSSHDTELFERTQLAWGAIALMLAPGGVQIFYGDETARQPGQHIPADPAQATRSDMNWDSVNKELLRHWQLLGNFRRRHVALARGAHQKLGDSPYVFARIDERSGDRVVVALGASGLAVISVGWLFADGQLLRDAYSGATVVVQEGTVSLVMGNVALLEMWQPGSLAHAVAGEGAACM